MKKKKKSPGTPIHLCSRTAVARQQPRHRNHSQSALKYYYSVENVKQFGTTYLVVAKCSNLQLFQIPSSSTASTLIGAATGRHLCVTAAVQYHCPSEIRNRMMWSTTLSPNHEPWLSWPLLGVCYDHIYYFLGFFFLSGLPIRSIGTSFSTDQYSKSKKRKRSHKAAGDSSETHTDWIVMPE